MIVHAVVKSSSVDVYARAEGDGGLVGDMFVEVLPGNKLLGLTYDEWRELGSGQHEISGEEDTDG